MKDKEKDRRKVKAKKIEVTERRKRARENMGV
jgi:hypothetical protein